MAVIMYWSVGCKYVSVRRVRQFAQYRARFEVIFATLLLIVSLWLFCFAAIYPDALYLVYNHWFRVVSMLNVSLDLLCEIIEILLSNFSTLE